MRTIRAVYVFLVLGFVFALFFIFFKEVVVTVSGARSFFYSFFDRAFSYEELRRLEFENKILKEEMERLRRLKGEEQPALKKERRRAAVYSSYPFNDKNVFVIDFGSAEGARVGMPVVLGENVLVGRIVKVSNFESLVRTIFDSGWVSGASIGLGEVRAALKGGLPPRLELVTRESEIKTGDLVYNTSPEFPLNMVVAVVDSAKQGSGKFWSEISVKPPFSRDSLRTVNVLVNFP